MDWAEMIRLLKARSFDGALSLHSEYETLPEEHHDHLIDMKTGKVIEFIDADIEALQEAIARKLGFKLVDHRLELYGLPLDE